MTWDMDCDGFQIVETSISLTLTKKLRLAIQALNSATTRITQRGTYAARGLLERVPEVAELARSDAARRLVGPILGPGWRPVRGIFFDKTPEANWKVPWHQDLTIAVREYRDVWGFAQWTVKGGVVHVQPPVEVLEQMVAVRFALDDNDEQNGPLRVLPGTHRLGRLRAEQIAELREKSREVVCCVPAGGALLMRPLLLHASSAMSSGATRRVVHIEFAGCDLPGGLEWAS